LIENQIGIFMKVIDARFLVQRIDRRDPTSGKEEQPRQRENTSNESCQKARAENTGTRHGSSYGEVAD
jgi:hypothetical protein